MYNPTKYKSHWVCFLAQNSIEKSSLFPELHLTSKSRDLQSACWVSMAPLWLLRNAPAEPTARVCHGTVRYRSLPGGPRGDSCGRQAD